MNVREQDLWLRVAPSNEIWHARAIIATVTDLKKIDCSAHPMSMCTNLCRVRSQVCKMDREVMGNETYADFVPTKDCAGKYVNRIVDENSGDNS